MSANDRHQARPVALLARAGAARERLKEAVLAAGGRLVLEEDPNALQAASLQAASVELVLVALEPAVEDALERLEPVLQAPHLNLMFEEAELAARREGWDAQRWTRHLAAKLQGHDNVLPPGQEPEAPALPEQLEPGMPQRPAERHADAPLQFHLDEAEQHAGTVPNDGLYVAPAARADERPEVLSFEELLARAPVAPAPLPEPPPAATPTPAAVAPPPLPLPSGSSDAPAPARGGFQDWALLDDDAYEAPVASPSPAATPVALERLLPESLSLVELEPETRAAETGAVLLLAGIGGPDAVRRLLASLPAEFPLPVLVQMRLDGGRYANLVKQMARAATLPVALAAAGQPLAAGNVYILQEGVGVAGGEDALRFIDTTAPLLPALPAQRGAVVLLSGADTALVPDVLAFAERGGWIAGQSGEGCYDPEAANHLAAAGHPSGTPEHLAGELAQRSEQ
ncbi:chemotaxis protein CheB [Stenotrophomonas mori]|uniref:chemotaxis protein CheB n=1 Tax=Stenotrophomonas mori TaxID=2871096 RepID=UPI003CE5680A